MGDIVQYDEQTAEMEFAAGMGALTVDDLKSRRGFLTTLPDSSPEDKVRTLNALSNPERLTDHEGEVIELAGVIAQDTYFRSAQHDGQKVKGVGIYLVATNGQSYITVSAGIYDAISRLLGVFGYDSSQWPKGLAIVPTLKNIGGGRRTWTVETVLPEAKK